MSGPKKVFDASHAPRDEVEGVLEALESAGYDVYEIKDSQLWGGGAICVRHADDREGARQVVESFQQQWRDRARESTDESKPNFWFAIPVVMVILVALLVNLIYLF